MGVVKPAKGSVRRAARLMKLGAGLAGSYLAYQLQRPLFDEEIAKGRRQALRSKHATRVRQELQELRGVGAQLN
jgi:hypothetical protein